MDGQDPRYKQYNGRGVPIDIFTGSNGLILTYRVSLNANNSVKKLLKPNKKLGCFGQFKILAGHNFQ